jgi:hypothetical protein
MTFDCTHHEDRRAPTAAVKVPGHTQLETDWTERGRRDNLWHLAADKKGLHIGLGLSLGWSRTAGREHGPNVAGQRSSPLRQHSSYPGWDILGEHILEPAGHSWAGWGNHCHILPVARLLQRLCILGRLRIPGCLLEKPPWDHSTGETDVLWKNDTPL